MLVYHPYVPGHRPSDQGHCWLALAELRLEVVTQILDWPCEDDYAYARGLGVGVGATSKVVVVEHDIAPTPAQVRELADCPRDFCAMDYYLPNGMLWTEVADHACLGLAKISEAAWDRTSARPAVPMVHWRDLAGSVDKRIGPAHVHDGPVAHHHQED